MHFSLLAALKTCLYSNVPDSYTSSFQPVPMEGFTHAADDPPEPRELRLVAMHLPDWEEVGRELDLDQVTLDQCKKSNRY